MDSNPILHLSPAKEMKCSFFYYVQLLMISQACRWTWTPSTTCLQPKMKCSYFNYVQLLMIGRAGQWTQTPSTTPLQPKKMKCLFLDYVHFWWSAWLIDKLEPHLPPSPAKKMKCSFLDYIQLLMIGQAGWWTQTPTATPLQSKNEILIFVLHSNSDDWPGWSMDSNPICHPSPAKKKWNAHFWITLNFWWLARLVDGLKPHLPPLFSQKMKSSFLDYVQLLMINQAG